MLSRCVVQKNKDQPGSVRSPFVPNIGCIPSTESLIEESFDFLYSIREIQSEERATGAGDAFERTDGALLKIGLTEDTVERSFEPTGVEGDLSEAVFDKDDDELSAEEEEEEDGVKRSEEKIFADADLSLSGHENSATIASSSSSDSKISSSSS